MLGVLPVVEDPDLSWSAAPALPQHLPPWHALYSVCIILCKVCVVCILCKVCIILCIVMCKCAAFGNWG